jgi:ATP-binding cassette subfamily G (WHITE) protein 2 (SNQ2)
MCVRCSGLAKPGEMILVIGCPGSGCTAFLRGIANRRDEYSSVRGNVCYGGRDTVEMRKNYKDEIVYNQDGMA